MHKLLLIGVGGTGGKILRFAWREIDARLRARDEERGSDRMPAAFQFLHFDLPEAFDGYKDKDVPRILSLDSEMYRNLAAKSLEYRDYDDAVVAALQRGLWGWRPHPIGDIPDPYLGAGQRRAVGRVVTISALNQIDTAIGEAAVQLGSNEANSDLAEVEQLFNSGGMATQRAGHVFIVGSLAGGSGSGMFLDVQERVLANSTAWFSNVEFILVTPDAFLSSPESEREGNNPNSFAALCEYLTAFSWQGQLHPHEAIIQGSAGVIRGSGRRTGERAFFIGGGNANVKFPRPTDLFRSVGKAIAAYATTPAIQDYFDTVVCNLNGSNARPGFFFADRGSSPLQPCGSFGFGTVSVGGDRLADYAAERLALASVRRLLCETTGTQTLAEYIEGRTQTASQEAFFEASGLWEYDPEQSEGSAGGPSERFHDQVLDELRTADLVKRGTQDVADKVLEALKPDTRPLSGNDAKAEFVGQFAPRASRYEEEARALRSTNARAWTLKVQRRLLDATLAVVARDGIAVAVRLLELLIGQIDAAADQLDAERERCSGREKDFYARAGALYDHVRDRITGSGEVHRNAAHYQHGALFQHVEAQLRDEAALLLRDASEGLVAPLHAGLQAFEERLRAARGDSDGAGAVMSRWSSGAVPDHLKVAKNERLLYPEEAMPADFEQLLMETTKQPAAMDAVSLAVSEIIRAGWPDERRSGINTDGGSPLLTPTGSWNSKHPFAQREGAAARADFSRTPGVLELLDRSREWVGHRQGALAERVSETLREHLDINAPNHGKRLRAFETELTNAFNCALPLVTINDRVRKRVHGDATEASYTATPMPFPDDHPARPVAEKVLLNFGVKSESTGQYFTTEAGGHQIEIFGFMTKSVHPVVISSLMDPIASAWARASSTREDRRGFWSFRRAHTLEMFCGLSPARQRALVKGWYIAAFLGYLDRLDPASQGAEPNPRVWSPRGWRGFPSPLLGRPVTRKPDLLPALLESFPLRFLELSRVVDDPEDGYTRLIELGGGLHDAEGELQCVELESWLRIGDRPESLTLPMPFEPRVQELQTAVAHNGGALGVLEARRRTAIEAFKAPRRAYEAVRDVPVDPKAFVADRRWEITGLVLDSLEELVTFVEELRLESAPTDPASIYDL